ncbi:hypothetical protein [Phascolarctobacterium sp.]|uniref:hypothetical protein n=1 Tax=Phascolarctobacterium sp. TaxID=2049039 RepID=UPI0015B135C8|nr:hypothetical protein [uncultured Phascolarctobacterium sp.]
MKFKNLLLTLGALMMLAFTSIASAAAPTQVNQSMAAINAAKAEIPAACELLGYNVDGGNSIITFKDPNTLERYVVEVNTATSKVDEIEVKGATFVMGSTMVTKTPEDIEQIVLQNYPGAYEIIISQGKDGNNIYYEADFLTDRFDGELKLDPVTGAICERELDYF